MDTLVTAQWLADHLDDPELVVLDCTTVIEDTEDGGFRPVSGRQGYEEAHIPGAGFADLTGELADGDSPYRFALPDPEQFCAAMGRLGVGDDSRVVLYDRSMTAWAARVWWMLRWVGFDNAALLDGGFAAWKEQGGAVSGDAATRPARNLTARPRPQLIADQDEVRAAVQNGAVCLIDTLSPQSFSGETKMYDRAGHIPGAVNLFGMRFLDETGRFKPADALADMHDGDRSARTITYCGGGILASLNAYVMTRIGFTDVAVYTASLQEWAADPANPMVTGDG